MLDIVDNILIGIIAGIFSSVIVSRIFLIESNYKQELDKIEKYIYSLSYLNGSLDVLIELQEKAFDWRKGIGKEQFCEKLLNFIGNEEVNQEKIKSIPDENLQKGMQDLTQMLDSYIDGDGLQNIKVKAEAFKNEMFLSYVKDKELSKIRDEIENTLKEIIKTKEFTFEEFRSLSGKMKKIRYDFRELSKQETKTIIRKVLKDRVMIILYILFAVIIIADVILKLLV